MTFILTITISPVIASKTCISTITMITITNITITNITTVIILMRFYRGLLELVRTRTTKGLGNIGYNQMSHCLNS